MRSAPGIAIAAVVALGLSGCAGLSTLTKVATPADLYDLTPKSTYDPDLPEIQVQLVIEEPTAASAVNTDRIAVRPSPFKVQYFPDARWVDRAPLLVQTMLLESFENTRKVSAVGRQAIGLNADFTLVTDLREFQAELQGDRGAALIVVVHLNMKIVKEPQGIIVASQSFKYDVPAASDDMETIVEAFDTALG
ncbi:MAG TPA: ABC-type transport auxiliary lipoprotein family protein, partial [Thermohalobaculum sp.]|nr:ABC-type transport auxiliary lipoprotein family protein [Thermohalobaculum sp.]